MRRVAGSFTSRGSMATVPAPRVAPRAIAYAREQVVSGGSSTLTRSSRSGAYPHAFQASSPAVELNGAGPASLPARPPFAPRTAINLGMRPDVPHIPLFSRPTLSARTPITTHASIVRAPREFHRRRFTKCGGTRSIGRGRVSQKFEDPLLLFGSELLQQRNSTGWPRLSVGVIPHEEIRHCRRHQLVRCCTRRCPCTR